LIVAGSPALQLRLLGRMNLPVDPILQGKVTSCGEAAIVMAYNYAFPEAPVSEAEVIKYATKAGWYTKHEFPFTSPQGMVNIARHYADTVTTGNVGDAEEALALLIENLKIGDPVVIDVLPRFDDPNSGGHFVVVTGMEITPGNPDATRISYNNPEFGVNISTEWSGPEGVWNAWQNNGDPGGSGWWMVIASP